MIFFFELQANKRVLSVYLIYMFKCFHLNYIGCCNYSFFSCLRHAIYYYYYYLFLYVVLTPPPLEGGFSFALQCLKI